MAKAQSKTQKKIENSIRSVLVDVCEQSLKDVDGFQWITHQVNFTDFPASLMITVVFDNDADCEQTKCNGGAPNIRKLIQAKLLKIGVKLKGVNNQIVFDSEESCERDHDGDWQVRFDARKGRSIPRNRPDHA